MTTRDELACDIMVGIGTLAPIWTFEQPICQDDPPLENPRLIPSTDLTPFVDYLIANGWTKEAPDS